MSLKITSDFNIKDIEKYTQDAINDYLDYVVEVYSNAGKAMVIDARSRTKGGGDSFGNITWELRSSIGCVVYRGTNKVFSYFPVLSTGAQGAQEGEDYADFVATQIIQYDEIVLVVVAGKEYAAAVESKGYNVITSTANIAESILESFINKAS